MEMFLLIYILLEQRNVRRIGKMPCFVDKDWDQVLDVFACTSNVSGLAVHTKIAKIL
jgi:hypothetical protein